MMENLKTMQSGHPQYVFVKDYERRPGRIVKRGTKGQFAPAKAKELLDGGYIKPLGSATAKSGPLPQSETTAMADNSEKRRKT